MPPDQDFAASVLLLRRRLRKGLATLFSPLVNWLESRGVTPDQITWAGFVLAFMAAMFAGFRLFLAAGIVYLASGIADLLDGALARLATRPTRAGAFLDSTLDRAGEGLVHAGAAVAFAYWGIWPGVLAVSLSLAGSYLTSYTRARAEGLGITLEEAWFGRGERLVVIALGLIFHFALIAFWIVAAVSWATTLQRGMLAHRRFREAALRSVQPPPEAPPSEPIAREPPQ